MPLCWLLEHAAWQIWANPGKSWQIKALNPPASLVSQGLCSSCKHSTESSWILELLGQEHVSTAGYTWISVRGQTQKHPGNFPRDTFLLELRGKHKWFILNLLITVTFLSGQRKSHFEGLVPWVLHNKSGRQDGLQPWFWNKTVLRNIREALSKYRCPGLPSGESY